MHTAIDHFVMHVCVIQWRTKIVYAIYSKSLFIFPTLWPVCCDVPLCSCLYVVFEYVFAYML